MCDAAPNGKCSASVFIPAPAVADDKAIGAYSLTADMERMDAQLSAETMAASGNALTQLNTKFGTCHFKAAVVNQTMSAKNVCFLPSRLHPPPAKIIGGQAGFVLGDLKIVTGNSVNMAPWQGPAYPNATTPYNNNVKVPSYACSTPYRTACLFNVSADPTEHNDLSQSPR